ncbi:CD3324 family protein [Paenibacillus endoradicis]|uniref:CD3324 family protein n=1 Tax=Paenibacillus endoradicis TaxID=2972487 RepID=UPI002158E1A3|nr:CD3324 family protein [Paenibacillus endoradicis]MCR8658699.1 CD3324 family protein [Paenibacillus endoradicis]
MEYINADVVLPEELLKEVQKYINGGMIYIPKPKGLRKGWGVNSGHRTYLTQRNDQIRESFLQGANIHQLSDQYFLSCDSIKKIVYKKSI